MAGVVFRFLSGDAMEVNDLQPFPPSSSYLLLLFLIFIILLHSECSEEMSNWHSFGSSYQEQFSESSSEWGEVVFLKKEVGMILLEDLGISSTGGIVGGTY